MSTNHFWGGSNSSNHSLLSVSQRSGPLVGWVFCREIKRTPTTNTTPKTVPSLRTSPTSHPPLHPTPPPPCTLPKPFRSPSLAPNQNLASCWGEEKSATPLCLLQGPQNGQTLPFGVPLEPTRNGAPLKDRPSKQDTSASVSRDPPKNIYFKKYWQFSSWCPF